VIRGERLIKLGNSWFSAKSMLVEYFYLFFNSKAINKSLDLTKL